MVRRPVPGPGPGNQKGGGKVGSIPLLLGNAGKSTGKKSATRTPATRIATNPIGKSVHIVVSLPAGPNRAL